MSHKVVNRKTGQTIKSNCDLKSAHEFVSKSKELRIDLRIVPIEFKKIFSNGSWIWGQPEKDN